MRRAFPCAHFVFLLSLAAFAVDAATAQPADTSGTATRDTFAADWWLGPHGGAVWSFHSGLRRWWPEPAGSIDADGVGLVAGLDATIRLGPDWYLAPIVSYESWRATSTDALEVELAMIEGAAEDTIDRTAAVIVESETDYAFVRTAVLFGTVVIGSMEESSLALEVGSTTALIVAGSLRNQIRIDPSQPGRFANPNGLPVSNDGRTMTLFDDDIPGRVGMRIGLLGGVRLRHRLSKRLDGWTALRYDVALTNVDEARWRASALLLTAGLQIDL